MPTPAQIDEQKMINPRGAEFIDPGGLVILEFTNNCRATIEQIEDGFCPLKIEAVFTNGYVEINDLRSTDHFPKISNYIDKNLQVLHKLPIIRKIVRYLFYSHNFIVKIKHYLKSKKYFK